MFLLRYYREADLGRRLSADDSVTAVFVSNDQMALGGAPGDARGGTPDSAGRERRRLRRHSEAPSFTPPLTTVRQDFGEVGSRSLRSSCAWWRRSRRASAR